MDICGWRESGNGCVSKGDCTEEIRDQAERADVAFGACITKSVYRLDLLMTLFVRDRRLYT